MSELHRNSAIPQSTRVLQVLPSIVPGGGAEQSLAMVAPLLLDRGIDLHMAFMDRGSDLVEDLREQGILVHDLSGGARVYPTWAVRLHRLIRQTKPAVVHATLFDAEISARLAGMVTPARSLSTWANTSYDPVRRRLEPGYGGWKRDAVRLVDMVTAHASRSRFHAVTEGVADDGIRALRVDRSTVFVVERGRDLSRFAPRPAEVRRSARDAMGAEAGDTVLINVARQFHQKGQVHLLRAFDRVADEWPAARLVLVGPEGPATSVIQAELVTLRHADRVVQLGQRTDIEDLLAGADVFVLSSVAEGAAGSILEAMAAGVPLVATRIEGLRGWVADGEHAVLAEPGDDVDLARVMASVLADPDGAAQRASRARAMVQRRFSLERCADGMAAMYRAVAAGAPSS